MTLDDYETRIAYLDEVQFSFELEFGKSLLLLSSGAFGLSLVFVDALEALNPSNTWSLVASWCFFGYSAFGTLLLFLVAQYAVKREGAKLEAYHKGDAKTKRLLSHVFSPSTGRFKKFWIAFRLNKALGGLYFLRWSTLIAFVVGIPLLAHFAVTNLGYNADPTLTAREQALTDSLRIERQRFERAASALESLRNESVEHFADTLLHPRLPNPRLHADEGR